MEITASELCRMLGGELTGNPDAVIDTVSKIEEGTPSSLSFLANPKYEQHIYSTRSAAVLVSKDFSPKEPVSATLIKVEDPYASFTAVLQKYNEIQQYKEGVEEPNFIGEGTTYGENLYLGAFAYLGKNVKLGNNVKIYPNSYIGDRVEIGDNTTVYPGVKIYHSCKLGSDCIIHAGAVIGSDGFGFAPQADGSYKKIPQIGNVIIEDNVEIGASTTIDRATMGSTIIRKGVKLDNLVQVAHNVEIGENTVIAAQTGISGSTKLGERCVIGGQVGFVGHITVAPGSQIGAQSGIPKAIKEAGKQWIGSPIMELKEAFKAQVIYRNLQSLKKTVDELERKFNTDKT